MGGVERVVPRHHSAHPAAAHYACLHRHPLMAKERQELEQRVDALTDALTGLPNRRALFEVADALGQNRQLGVHRAHLRSR